MEIITRKAAQSLGLKRYYTGLPCASGHNSYRVVSGGYCFECNVVAKAKYRSANAEKVKQDNAKSYQKHRQAVILRSTEWRKSHIDQWKQYAKDWARINSDAIRQYRAAFNKRHSEKLKVKARAAQATEKFKSRIANYKKKNDAAIKARQLEYRTKNKEAIRLNSIEYRQRNATRTRAQGVKYRADNLHKERARSRAYYGSNKAGAVARVAARRAAKLRATPPWANRSEIKEIYEVARASGKHVDHVIPLAGKLVCGLHVENNLQLLDPLENFRKGCSFDPNEFS